MLGTANLSSFFWLVILILAFLVVLSALSADDPKDSAPEETIHKIGIQARQKVHTLSEEVLWGAIDLLINQKRR
jgi:hypothetical protein